ncbi:MAG TPA: hypothetical protein VKB79_23115 [Bryobacteraceae bacterium]|nr:hypothetical protein [Bryobacteraceae bacterium]
MSEWQSRRTIASNSAPGVEFVIARMTFGRRLELMKRVRDLAVRIEYFEAGREEKNRIEASLLGAQIDRLYVEWGVERILGLEIDGESATPLSLIDSGPEDLFREALEAVRAECGLNEPERKN